MRFFRKKSKADDMFATLCRARDVWDIQPDFVIDVGAAEGKWSTRCAEIWPDASFTLIEPLQEHSSKLGEIAKRENWEYEFFVAGEGPGSVDFSVTDDLDGSGVYDKGGRSMRCIEVRALDSLPPKKGRGLLKLDTHGYEVPILTGATSLLDQIDLVVIEVYGHRISGPCLLFYEICALMAEKGFRVAGIVDPMQRPRDGVFWQADFFFLRESHPVFQTNTYNA